MNVSRTWAALLLAVLLSPTAFGQSNLPAVDTLKKEVAKAVFKGIKGTKDDGDKAEQIRQLLAGCGTNCEPGLLIRQIGGWDAVAQKLTFFDALRKDSVYVRGTPEVAVIRHSQILADFYDRHEKEVIYKKALGKEARQVILGKVNQVLPGALPEPDTTLVQANDPEAALLDSTGVDETLEDEPVIASTMVDRQVPIWMILAGAVGGLFVGWLLTYVVLKRRAKTSVATLKQEIEALKQRAQTPPPAAKPVNTPNPPNPTSEVIPLPKNVQKQVEVLQEIMAELNTLDPLMAIRQLKDSVMAADPVPSPVASEPLRMEVMYYPAPNEQGLFDDSQRSAVPTPDSAYKILIDPQAPTLARFRFEPEPGRMKRFLTYRTYFIDPACESENTFQEDSHSRIVTRREGSVTRENGIWRVQHKAVIRFE